MQRNCTEQIVERCTQPMYGQLGHFNGLLRASSQYGSPPAFILIFVERQKLVAYNFALVAAVAQSVEQRIRNAKVTSSIPVSGTSKIKHLAQPTRLGFLFSRAM